MPYLSDKPLSSRANKIASTRTVGVKPPQPIYNPSTMQSKAPCSCGGGCPKCQSVQAKLKIGSASDHFELEADRVADQVMRMPNSTNRGSNFAGSKASGSAIPGQIQGGQALDTTTREFFEPRFGYDFAQVRIHNNNQAAESAHSLQARAYTLGNDVVFNKGEYDPGSSSGKKLLAHELTHVVQQRRGQIQRDTIRRTVSDRSRCPANENGSGPIPEISLGLVETVAGMFLRNALVGLIFDIQSLEAGNRPSNSRSFDAYLTRFGLPERLPNRRFRDRFRGSRHASEDLAIAAELTQLKARLERIGNLFSRPIRYNCASEDALVTVGDCSYRCVDREGEAFAWVCLGSGGRTIVICPAFWSMNSDNRAIGLIHEATHLEYGFGDPTGQPGDLRRRGRNPVCYSGFVASVAGSNPPDNDCPPVPNSPGDRQTDDTDSP